MSDRSKMVLESASKLSVQERAEIAEALLAGLDAEDDGPTAEEINAAILAEARRRLEDFRNGKLETIDGAEAMRVLDEKYGK